MSGDYKIEVDRPRGHVFISEDSFVSQAEARKEIRRRHAAGGWGKR